MTPADMRKKIDAIEAKYGSDFEFFIHGPGAEGNFLSGFGPEVNWYMSEMTLGDGQKVKVCFMHGLPIQFEGEDGIRFPVVTGSFPLHHKLIKRGEADF